MSWPFETSEPFITPAHATELQRARRGLTPEEWALPATLVATFQPSAHERLLERGGVPPGAHESRPGSSPLGLTVGAAGNVPVAVALISIGAPAAAVVLEEAIARGVRNVLVAGAAGSLQPALPLGSTVLVEGAEREDGASHHYLPAGEVVSADPELTAMLEEWASARGASPVRGRSWTIDAPYRETVGAIRRHREAGVSVVEMEAAAMFAVARVRGVRAALVVAVSDELFGDDWNPGFGHAVYLDSLLRAADAAMDVAARLG
jgi:nucleoside phosphorylase